MKNGSKLAPLRGVVPHLLGELARRAGVAARSGVGLPLRVQPRVRRRAVHRRGRDELAVVVGDEDGDRRRRLGDDVIDDAPCLLELHASDSAALVIVRRRQYHDATMSAHAAPAAGAPDARDPRHAVPGPAAEAERSAAASRCDDHVAAGARPGRVPLPGLDRADPDLARSRARCSRSGSRSRRQHVLLWPASALLTGNGVAFILRVPGTQHGDWWSTARLVDLRRHRRGLAALEVRDRVARQPRLQPVELRPRPLLPARSAATRAEPLDFWWGPMSWWLALATAIIVAGGLAILSRLRAARRSPSASGSRSPPGSACSRRAGHAMTARWHLGPITGHPLLVGARHLARDPRLPLLHDHRPEDGAARPRGRGSRTRSASGCSRALLIAPVRTEYATKVALLGALAIVCAAAPARRSCCRCGVRLARRGLARRAASPHVAAYVGVLVAASCRRARRRDRRRGERRPALPPITIVPSRGVHLAARPADGAAHRARPRARRCPRPRTHDGCGSGSSRARDRTRRSRSRGSTGTEASTRRSTCRPARAGRSPRRRCAGAGRAARRGRRLRGYRARRTSRRTVGLDFRQGAFRYGIVGSDPPAMMGGGLCWLDYDNDGWLDLFVVNSYTDDQLPDWQAHGGLPRERALPQRPRAVRERHDARRAPGCRCAARAASPPTSNGDGHTDLFVTTATNDVLLWNNGDGTFTEGARKAGVVSFGWHSGAAVADVNGDGRPDLFVAGYTEHAAPDPELRRRASRRTTRACATCSS